MKKIFTILAAMLVAPMVLFADSTLRFPDEVSANEDQKEKEGVSFAYDAGFELVSMYLWRGQYNGGLSFQPDLEIGYDGKHTSFRVGVWANIGASDWKFQKGLPEYFDGVEDINPNTYFSPELDVVASFSFFGATVGVNHYYYCDGSNFFSWQSAQDVYDKGNTSSTEIWAGYDFEHFFGQHAYINWYTTIAGKDLRVDEFGVASRVWSSYLELGYDYTWENIGLTFGGAIGIAPWENPAMGNDKFAVTNLSLKLNKEWEFDVVTLDLFAQGSLNPDGVNKYNAFVNAAGDEKIGVQKLNGVIGLGVWF